MNKYKNNNTIALTMRLPPNYWSCVRWELEDFEWKIFFPVATLIVSITYLLMIALSVQMLGFLLTLLYPLPICLYRAFERCKPNEPLRAVQIRSF